jgi:hypothetical protein
MLGRNSYTREELDSSKTGVSNQLAAYRRLAAAVGNEGPDGDAAAVLEGFEAPYFNNMVIVLDRYFVHRVRNVTGKDGNPLNEVELLADSLMNNGGVLKGSNVIKLNPEESVLKLQIGDPIRVTAEEFERLAAAFIAEIERKFL